MDEQEDDIPMMDAPEPAPNMNPSSSSAQRFSIVDVLGGGDGISVGASNAKEMIVLAPPDPVHSVWRVEGGLLS
jgi:hypothetical protein